MIFKTLAIALVLIVNACTPTEKGVQTTDPVTADLKANVSGTEEFPFIYLEELHYMSLYQEFGEDHDLIVRYRDEFDTFLPGKGCPKPRPCDIITNCLRFEYQEILKGLSSYLDLNYFNVNVYSDGGEFITSLAGSETMKCPKPRQITGHYFESPIQDGLSGYFEIQFASEELGGEFQFKVPFAPAE